MSLQVDWQGVYPAVPTQFKEDLTLDIPATKKHVEILLENGIHGLVMLGTIGENCSLSLEEKLEVSSMFPDSFPGSTRNTTGSSDTEQSCSMRSPRQRSPESP